MSASTIEVYGSSDDLIEFGGDIYEEYEAERGSFVLDDGTSFTISYTNEGFWRFTMLDFHGDSYEFRRGKDIDDDYSDYVVMHGSFTKIDTSGII